MDNQSRVLEFIRQGEEIAKVENHSKVPGVHVVYGERFDQWMSSIMVFANRFLKNHPLFSEIQNAYSGRKGMYAFDDMMGHLRALSSDDVYFSNSQWSSEVKNQSEKVKQPQNKRTEAKHDVFISHANADKAEYVNDLKKSIDTLNIDVFYDKDSLEWGDNWKEKLQSGIDNSEFAIIVISENYFGREWTEKELYDFLNRQNSSGQKIILPILHNIAVSQLKERYPSIADIQALNSKDYSCDQIALLFARLLITRIRSLTEYPEDNKNQGNDASAAVGSKAATFLDLKEYRFEEHDSDETQEEWFAKEHEDLMRAEWLSDIERNLLFELIDLKRKDAVSYTFACLARMIDASNGKKDCYYSMLPELAGIIQNSQLSSYNNDVELCIMELIRALEAIERERPTQEGEKTLQALKLAQQSGNNNERFSAIKCTFYYIYKNWDTITTLNAFSSFRLMSNIAIPLSNAPDSPKDRKSLFDSIFNSLYIKSSFHLS